MYMFKVSNDKVTSITEYVEKGLRYIGKAMQCLEDLKGEEEYNQRSGYGMRDNMNYRYPERDDEDMHEDYSERRGRNSMGRYTRM